MEFYGNTIFEWLIAGIIITSGFFLAKLVYWICKNILRKLTKNTKTDIDDLLIDNIEEPFVFSIIIFSFWISTQYLNIADGWSAVFGNTIYVLFAINITWLVSRIFTAVVTKYLEPLVEKTESDLDDQLLPIVKKGINITIWTLGILVGLNNVGINVSALLAGLGIGGLAFAMASKDTIANLFAGLTIFTDHPFKINERIKTKEFDGYVREIGLRTTRIETREGSLVIVPNNKISNETIENISLEKFRRVDKIIYISNTMRFEKVTKAVEVIISIVSKHEAVESHKVGFCDFNEFSFGIRVVYDIKKYNDFKEYIEKQNGINLLIVQQLNKQDIAFPKRVMNTE